MNQYTAALRRVSSTYRTLGTCLTLVVITTALSPAAAVELVPEAAVRQRADQRWQMMIDGKYEEAYRYLAPGFQAVQSFRSYTSSFANTAWTGGKAVRVECNDERDKCTATVRVDAKVFMPGLKLTEGQGGNVTSYIQENWIRQNGNWWLFPQS